MSSVCSEAPAPARSRQPRPQGVYRPELDWLRFLAFFAVFLHHSFPHQPEAYSALATGFVAKLLAGAALSGEFGVDLFFALSAFLITDLLLREWHALGRIDLPAFYIRRSLRIWPLYFLFLLLSWLVFKPPLSGQVLLLFLCFVGNWSCVFCGYPQSVAAPLWSVSIEEQFYLSWPPLLALCGIKRLPLLAGAFLILSSVVRLFVVLSGAEHPAIWCNTFARLDPIALGIALAAFRPRLPEFGSMSRLVLMAVGCAGIIACGCLNTLSGWRALFGYPVVALSCALLLVGFLGLPVPRSAIASWVLARFAYLGKISYGLYVFHMLGLDIARRFNPGGLRTVCLGLLFTVGMSIVSYELVEAPFLRLKRRFTRIPSRPV